MTQDAVTLARHAGETYRFAFIQASWHTEIVDQGRIGFLAELDRRGLASDRVETFRVPGSFEIPLRAKLLARSGRYDAIIACGLVVDGGIYRHDFVADAVIKGLMTVQLETEIPIVSMVLTPHHFHEHEEHRAFFLKHFLKKGEEAAAACLNTLASMLEPRPKHLSGSLNQADASLS